MKIYVGNLYRGINEDEVESLFKEYGTVITVNIVRDMFSRESKGFGFVEMKERPGGLKAVSELHDKEIQGRKIIVNEARPQNSGTRKPGRRY